MLRVKHITQWAVAAAMLVAMASAQSSAPPAVNPQQEKPAATNPAAGNDAAKTDEQDLPFTWMKPEFKAGPKKVRKITLVKHFPYTEMLFSPPVVVPAVPPTGASFKTPEAALFERFAAMRRLNYEEWLKTWDEPGQKFIAARNAQQKVLPQTWTERWKRSLATNSVTMVRRVETGDYVVLTYQVGAKAGQFNPAALELPVIFRKVGERWLGTQDLVKDPLVPLSPWVTGKTEQKVKIR